MRKASLMSRYANPGTPEYRQKRMCFSIFFRGCKLLKSLHISFFGGKDSANRTQNKMNLFIFYAEVQPVFVFATNISTLF